jgi:uncharacterized OsmC-like protein
MMQYEVRARSTETFGRVLVNSRNHHFVVDGPASNGCPGEALTPAELFLAGIAACGVELVQVIARRRQVPLEAVGAVVSGRIDLNQPVRPDLTLFNGIRLEFLLKGVTSEQGAELVAAFKRR